MTALAEKRITPKIAQITPKLAADDFLNKLFI
jgi:hypothetical protein